MEDLVAIKSTSLPHEGDRFAPFKFFTNENWLRAVQNERDSRRRKTMYVEPGF